MNVPSDTCLSVLAERDLLPTDRHAVYLAGSLVRGWGNEGSDLDVYVVTAVPWKGLRTATARISAKPGTVPAKAFYVDGRRWDIEYWLDTQVDDLLDRFSWDAFDTGQTADPYTKDDTAFIHRLAFAQVVEGGDWIRRCRQKFDDSAVKSIVARQKLQDLDHYTEDAAGMLANDDGHSAVLAAHLALGAAVDAFLAIHGEFEDTPKWRARKLQAVASAELKFDKYWALETMRSYDPEAPGKWISDVLYLCQRIAEGIEL